MNDIKEANLMTKRIIQLVVDLLEVTQEGGKAHAKPDEVVIALMIAETVSEDAFKHTYKGDFDVTTQIEYMAECAHSMAHTIKQKAFKH